MVDVQFFFYYINAAKALKEIATTLGIKGLDLKSEDPCTMSRLKFDFVRTVGDDVNNTIKCGRCDNMMTCHITDM